MSVIDILNKVPLLRPKYVGNFSYKEFRGVITEDSIALFTTKEIKGKTSFRGYYFSAADAMTDIDNEIVKI